MIVMMTLNNHPALYYRASDRAISLRLVALIMLVIDLLLFLAATFDFPGFNYTLSALRYDLLSPALLMMHAPPAQWTCLTDCCDMDLFQIGVSALTIILWLGLVLGIVYRVAWVPAAGAILCIIAGLELWADLARTKSQFVSGMWQMSHGAAGFSSIPLTSFAWAIFYGMMLLVTAMVFAALIKKEHVTLSARGIK